MSGLLWIQTVWLSDGIPEWYFLKKLILKKSADNKIVEKIAHKTPHNCMWIINLHYF